jgi:hypothetical protein
VVIFQPFQPPFLIWRRRRRRRRRRGVVVKVERGVEGVEY